jgi:hypothetical protein
MWTALNSNDEHITTSLMRSKKDAYHNISVRLMGQNRYNDWEEGGYRLKEVKNCSLGDTQYSNFIRSKKK